MFPTYFLTAKVSDEPKWATIANAIDSVAQIIFASATRLTTNSISASRAVCGRSKF